MQDDPSAIWNEFLRLIELKLPHESFLTWFAPLRFLGMAEGVLTVGVPNHFFYEFLESHYHDQVLATMQEVSPEALRLHYQIMEESQKELPAGEVVADLDLFPSDGGFDQRTQLNPRYTFENFVEGDSNSFARAAALAVAEAPGKTPFNPLFIYGTTGLGKTHLIQAIGNFSLARNRALRTIYVTSEKFMNDFVFAIKTYKTTDFARFYRSVDLLLLDDIQFFQGKERTQLEFFHTFNTLYQAGKQIVLSSDRPLKELSALESRLVSRIGWGLVTDIHPPDFETRLAILQKRSDIVGFHLPDDVAQLLAGMITDNVRDLEGALIRLMAQCSILGTDISLELAQKTLHEYLPLTREDVTVERIQQIVAHFYKVSVEQMTSSSRKREVVWARQVAMYLSKELTQHTLQNIGRLFGDRDHSTVIHARTVVVRTLAQDIQMAQQISALKSEIIAH